MNLTVGCPVGAVYVARHRVPATDSIAWAISYAEPEGRHSQRSGLAYRFERPLAPEWDEQNDGATHGDRGKRRYRLEAVAQAPLARMTPLGRMESASGRTGAWTPLVFMSFPADKNAEFRADTPLGRRQPGERAPIYVSLASEDSQDISG
jgi:hypothetical protein